MQRKYFLPIILASLSLSGCQIPNFSTNTNSVNTNTVNTNVNSTNSNVNNSNKTTNVTPNTVSVVATREPEKYQAKITIKVETLGDAKTASLPPLTAILARDGMNHRMEFTLPNNEKIVYLDAGDKHLLISPDRKQFAELNKDSVGFDIRQMMMPGQIVDQIKAMKGIEFVGEDLFNNRPVLKYRYGKTTDTQTQAGQVTTESFLLVDKETGLPVRSETQSQSQNGKVQGVSGLKIITEMSDIKTDAPIELFAEPKDYKKVEEAEVKGQMNLLFSAISAIFGQILNSAQKSPSPTVSPTL